MSETLKNITVTLIIPKSIIEYMKNLGIPEVHYAQVYQNYIDGFLWNDENNGAVHGFSLWAEEEDNICDYLGE